MNMTTEDKLLNHIFGNDITGTLKSNLPCGYSEKGMGRNDEVNALLEVKVIKTHSMSMDVDDPRENHPIWPKIWPGPEKNVFRWYELEDGNAVGWIQSDPWQFKVLKT